MLCNHKVFNMLNASIHCEQKCIQMLSEGVLINRLLHHVIWQQVSCQQVSPENHEKFELSCKNL